MTAIQMPTPETTDKPPTPKQLKELQKLVQEYDPASKRVAFTGWPDAATPEERLKMINDFVAINCANACVMDTGNFFWGPCSDRKITKAA